MIGVEAVSKGNPSVSRFEDSVFTGQYVTQDVSDAYLSQLELFRSDAAKQSRGAVGDSKFIDLHNPV